MACRSSSSWIGSPVSAHEQTTRVGARSSFEADSGPAASLSRSSALRPDHPEAPGVGQVVVGGPAGELEDLLEHARGRPARAGRPCGSAGADRLLDFHRGRLAIGRLASRGGPAAGAGRGPNRPRPRRPPAATSGEPISQPGIPPRSRRRRVEEAGAAADGVGSPDGADRRGRRGALFPACFACLAPGPSLALPVARAETDAASRSRPSRHRRSAGRRPPLAASRAWPVTQTGVWSLEAE